MIICWPTGHQLSGIHSNVAHVHSISTWNLQMMEYLRKLSRRQLYLNITIYEYGHWFGLNQQFVMFHCLLICGEGGDIGQCWIAMCGTLFCYDMNNTAPWILARRMYHQNCNKQRDCNKRHTKTRRVCHLCDRHCSCYCWKGRELDVGRPSEQGVYDKTAFWGTFTIRSNHTGLVKKKTYVLKSCPLSAQTKHQRRYYYQRKWHQEDLAK